MSDPAIFLVVVLFVLACVIAAQWISKRGIQ